VLSVLSVVNPLPNLPPMPLRLYNTLTRRVEDFIPRDPDRVTFYTCGPTVYDDAHIGNFRSFLAADVLRRFIESPLCELALGGTGVPPVSAGGTGVPPVSAGGTGVPPVSGKTHPGPRTVVHVMNITDVGHMTDDAEGGESGEDRMAVAGRRIAEAKKAGKLPADVKIDPSDPYQIARFYEERFREDGRRLGLKVAIDADTTPTRMPKATQNIAGMIAVIARLIDRAHAYVTGDPGSRVVYFRVKSFPPYGRLSGNTIDSLREGEGGRISTQNQSTKEHPADFLLWKEDPRHIMKWDSPWGAGYPGWHIECSVMSAEGTEASRHQGIGGFTLPDGESVIDLHSGGEDNIFPHHECEIAQSCCAFNQTPDQGSFARMWFHPRFLLVEGTKMSKSKGNFFTARDLFAPPPQGKGIEPAALRLELIKTHYRSNANFTMQGLADSQRRLERWRLFAAITFELKDEPMSPSQSPLPGNVTGLDYTADRHLRQFQEEFAAALHNDLNISQAIATLDSRFGENREELRKRVAQSLAEPLDDSRLLANLPEAAMPVADAIASLERGRENRTHEWEWGLLNLIDSVLGVIFVVRPKSSHTDIGIFVGGLAPDPAVIAKLEERRQARASKNFKRSDEIRDELLAIGYAIKDAAGGKVEVSRAAK